MRISLAGQVQSSKISRRQKNAIIFDFDQIAVNDAFHVVQFRTRVTLGPDAGVFINRTVTFDSVYQYRDSGLAESDLLRLFHLQADENQGRHDRRVSYESATSFQFADS